jgi:hypothetical protein
MPPAAPSPASLVVVAFVGRRRRHFVSRPDDQDDSILEIPFLPPTSAALTSSKSYTRLRPRSLPVARSTPSRSKDMVRISALRLSFSLSSSSETGRMTVRKAFQCRPRSTNRCRSNASENDERDNDDKEEEEGDGRIDCRRRRDRMPTPDAPSRRRDLIDGLRCCPRRSRSHCAPRSRRLSLSSLSRSRGHENRSGAGVNFIPYVSHAQSVEQVCVVWQVEYAIVVLGDSGVHVTIILQSCPAVFTSAGIERNLSLSLSLILISFTTVQGMKR